MKRVILITLVAAAGAPSLATAQLTAADLQEATRRFDNDASIKSLINLRAVADLEARREINKFQRVELDGIIATDPTPERLKKFFDGPHLQPAHNSTDAMRPEPGVKKWWEKAFESITRGSNNSENVARDINDLFDDKTGHLTERGLETLQPIMGENVSVNEIVAHSWGAVLLHNAILEGLVKPPKRIIVVGVPDGDLRKWRMLADNTGTDVVIVQNKNDHAVGSAGIVDDMNDSDVAGGNKRYNDGLVADRWRGWKKVHPELTLPQRGDFKSWEIDLPKDGNRIGHDRLQYFNALVEQGIIEKTAEEMAQAEKDLLDERASELREQEIRGIAEEIRFNREAQEQFRREAMRAAPARPEATLPPVDRYWLARALSDVAKKVCADPSSLTQDDMFSLGVTTIVSKLVGAEEFSASLTGCPKYVFDAAVPHYGRRDGITREMFSYWAQEYQQRQTPQETPSFDDGDGRGKGGTDSNDDCVTPPGSPRACPGIRR